MAGSIDRRIEALERLYQSEGDEELSAKLAAIERMREKTAREFEQRLARRKRSLAELAEGILDLTELRRKPPVEIAAAYVVLMQRGEHAMAEAVKDLYDDVKAERKRWPVLIELEEWAPGMGDAYDGWFWEMVERLAAENLSETL